MQIHEIERLKCRAVFCDNVVCVPWIGSKMLSLNHRGDFYPKIPLSLNLHKIHCSRQ